MGKSYSSDLRERVVSFVGLGHSRRAAARHFGVSESFAVKLLQRVAKTGAVAPARQGRPPGKGKLAAHRAYLVSCIADKSDITMPELASKLEAETGVRVQPASLSRFLRKAGLTYKKSPDGLRTRASRHPPGAPAVDRRSPAENAP